MGAVVGRCHRCAVSFGARRGERAAVRGLQRLHERVCPGGARGHEVVWPLAVFDESGCREDARVLALLARARRAADQSKIEYTMPR